MGTIAIDADGPLRPRSYLLEPAAFAYANFSGSLATEPLIACRMIIFTSADFSRVFDAEDRLSLEEVHVAETNRPLT